MGEHVIIDTDVGFDDVFAINMLLQTQLATKQIHIHLITTCSGLQEDTSNARQILRRLMLLTPGLNIPVVAGDAPFRLDVSNAHYFKEAPFCTEAYLKTTYQMADSLDLPTLTEEPSSVVDQSSISHETKQEMSAVEALLHAVNSHPAQHFTLIAIGPLTNVARAIQLDRNWFPKLKRVIIMGGALDFHCDVTHNGSEWNFYCDSIATQVVLQASAARVDPVVVVGQDCANMNLNPPEKHQERVDWVKQQQVPSVCPVNSSPVQRLAAMLRLLHAVDPDACVFDPIAITFLLRPEWYEMASVNVEVLTSKPDEGRIVRNSKGVPLLFAKSVHIDNYFSLVKQFLLGLEEDKQQ